MGKTVNERSQGVGANGIMVREGIDSVMVIELGEGRGDEERAERTASGRGAFQRAYRRAGPSVSALSGGAEGLEAPRGLCHLRSKRPGRACWKNAEGQRRHSSQGERIVDTCSAIAQVARVRLNEESFPENFRDQFFLRKSRHREWI